MTRQLPTGLMSAYMPAVSSNLSFACLRGFQRQPSRFGLPLVKFRLAICLAKSNIKAWFMQARAGKKFEGMYCNNDNIEGSQGRQIYISLAALDLSSFDRLVNLSVHNLCCD